MAKCTVLANHYFGFNGWSTKIVQVVKLSCLDILNLFCYNHLGVLIDLFVYFSLTVLYSVKKMSVDVFFTVSSLPRIVVDTNNLII